MQKALTEVVPKTHLKLKNTHGGPLVGIFKFRGGRFTQWERHTGLRKKTRPALGEREDEQGKKGGGKKVSGTSRQGLRRGRGMS